MTFDYYPTPAQTAAELVNLISVDEANSVADFSAGHGSLLVQALHRWPQAKIIATDIQRKLTRRMSTQFPSWRVGTCNFLADRSANSCGALKNLHGKVDVILLNPPFSKASGDLVFGDQRNVQVRCSPALHFMLRAGKFLSPNGELSAVLPITALYGSKDARARKLLEEHWSINIAQVLGRKVFPNCNVETALVTMRARSEPLSVDSAIDPKMGAIAVPKIIRGRLPVHIATPSNAKTALPYVHSVHLRNNRLLESEFRVRGATSVAEGPAVLVHRVGRPHQTKIAVLKKGHEIALSDCVIAIAQTSNKKAEDAKRKLIKNYEFLAAQYRGTGAPYITIERLESALGALEIY